MFLFILAAFAPLLQNSAALTCPSSIWTPLEATGSCYLPMHQQSNYYTAETNCRILGGEVASIGSAVEMAYVNTLFGGRNYWIGFRKQSSVWYWSDLNNATYLNWRSSQPDGCCGVDVTCVIANYADESGTWDDAGCQNIFNGFVCKTAGTGGATTPAPTPSCAAGWTPFPATGSCYLPVRRQSNYYNADAYCRMMGGYVTSITSHAEMSFVNNLFDGTAYWIGIRKVLGYWRWENATLAIYSNWRISQPDGCCGTDVTCAIANYADLTGTWDDAGCQNIFNGFVCKTTSTAVVAASAPTPPCPPGWTLFSTTESCYLPVRKQSNYYTADTFCRIMGGYVTSIMNFVEMSFVNGLFGGTAYWIGIRKVSGEWVWENATLVTYSNWRISQPDGCCGTDVTCAIANYADLTGTWDDAGCQNIFNGFVCKTAAITA